MSAWFVWKRLSAENGLGFVGGGGPELDTETGGGSGVVNMGAGNDCSGGVGRGGPPQDFRLEDAVVVGPGWLTGVTLLRLKLLTLLLQDGAILE